MGEGTPGAEPDWVWRQYQHTCIHFVAASADGTTGAGCRAGVSLAAATDAAGHLACFAGPGALLGCGVACPLASYPTEAQARAAAAASEAQARAYLADIRAGRCPHHRHPVRLRQVGRSVYAEPCGCRLYQGTLPHDDPPATDAASLPDAGGARCPSPWASAARVAAWFVAGLLPGLAAILLGGGRPAEAAGWAALVALPLAIWRGWFAGRGERGGDT